MLMMGIMAYNMSSQLSLNQHGDGQIVGKAAVNTLLSGSSGAIVASLLGKLTSCGSYRWSYFTMINGAVRYSSK